MSRTVPVIRRMFLPMFVFNPFAQSKGIRRLLKLCSDHPNLPLSTHPGAEPLNRYHPYQRFELHF